MRVKDAQNENEQERKCRLDGHYYCRAATGLGRQRTRILIVVGAGGIGESKDSGRVVMPYIRFRRQRSNGAQTHKPLEFFVDPDDLTWTAGRQMASTRLDPGDPTFAIFERKYVS